MNISRLIKRAVPLLAIVVCCPGFAADTGNDDVVPPRVQSDDRINVWVNEAPLSLFVSQLATITNRTAAVDGDISGTVSGQFNGSLTETLITLSEQAPVIFDLSNTSLGVVPESSRQTLTVALADTSLDDAELKALIADIPPGNDIAILDTAIQISGHPTYVQRMAAMISPVDTTIDEPVDEPVDESLAQSSVDQVIEDTSQPEVSDQLVASDELQDDVVDVQVEQTTVTDLAAQQLLSDDADSEALVTDETASASKPIRSVTDIPGFFTF